MSIAEDSFSYELAKELFEQVQGFPPQIIEGNINHELIVAALQKGIVAGAKYQEERMYSEKEVEKLLIETKDRFGGGDLEDYTPNDTVIKWFNNIKKNC